MCARSVGLAITLVRELVRADTRQRSHGPRGGRCTRRGDRQEGFYPPVQTVQHRLGHGRKTVPASDAVPERKISLRPRPIAIVTTTIGYRPEPTSATVSSVTSRLPSMISRSELRVASATTWRQIPSLVRALAVPDAERS